MAGNVNNNVKATSHNQVSAGAVSSSNNTQGAQGTNNASVAEPLQLTILYAKDFKQTMDLLQEAELHIASLLVTQPIGTRAVIYVYDPDGTKHIAYGARVPKGSFESQTGAMTGSYVNNSSMYQPGVPAWVKSLI